MFSFKILVIVEDQVGCLHTFSTPAVSQFSALPLALWHSRNCGLPSPSSYLLQISQYPHGILSPPYHYEPQLNWTPHHEPQSMSAGNLVGYLWTLSILSKEPTNNPFLAHHSSLITVSWQKSHAQSQTTTNKWPSRFPQNLLHSLCPPDLILWVTASATTDHHPLASLFILSPKPESVPYEHTNKTSR